MGLGEWDVNTKKYICIMNLMEMCVQLLIWEITSPRTDEFWGTHGDAWEGVLCVVSVSWHQTTDELKWTRANLVRNKT